jgi:hypothetical protein
MVTEFDENNFLWVSMHETKVLSGLCLNFCRDERITSFVRRFLASR